MPAPKIVFAFCLIGLVCSGSRAQQTVPPPPKPAEDASRAQPVPLPPKPADDGPGLGVTMKFIQDKLNDVGPLRWTVTSQSPDTGDDLTRAWTFELFNVIADSQRCTISYHMLMSVGGVGPSVQQLTPTHRAKPDRQAQPGDGPTLVLNLKEIKKITVKSREEASKENGGDATVRPPIFLIEFQQSRNRKTDFYVDDEEQANRLARAINHAVELCTPDKAPEPF